MNYRYIDKKAYCLVYIVDKEEREKRMKKNLCLKGMAVFLCLLLSISLFPKTTLASVPATPTGLTATAQGGDQINLTWDYASGATSYNIYRAYSYYGSYTYIGSEFSQGHADTGLSPNTTYFYKIFAVNSDGQSSYSTVASATTSYSSSGMLTATANGSGQIYLSWPSISGAYSYTLYRSTSYSGNYSISTITTSTGFPDSGLTAGTTYYYRLDATNSSGTTIYSSSIVSATAYSSSSSGDLTATSSGSNQIYLSWPSVSGVSNYTITRATSYSGSYSTIYTTSGTNYTDYNLSTGTTYYYRVQGVNSYGSTVYTSSIASASPNSSSSGDLTATSSGTNQIYLSWPSVSGVSNYTITRATSYSGSYSTIYTTSGTNYTDYNLSTGTTYYYRVQGVNSYGSTVYTSSIASASPNSSSSSSSGGLSATAVSSSQIYLSWSVVSETSYYLIARSTSYSGSYSNLYTTSSTCYTDTGLSSGTTYYYKVQAVNSSGATIYTSAIASATTSWSNSSPQLTSDRLAGDDRYQTSKQISESGWTSSYYAVIVSGENYPDALCSAPLAYKYNAPILLTSYAGLDSQTRDELQRLGVKSVFLIGGTRVISANTEQALLNMGITVTRIAGTDRYDTSLRIAQAIGASDEAVVANGDSFADALSVAPIAAITSMPILLTPANSISGSLLSYLQNQVQVVYVLGGTGAISDAVYNRLPSPQRISGTNRYETNINIVKKFSSQLNLNTCYLATGQTFPDALAGSALASLKKSPIILVSGSSLDATTLSFIQERTGTINRVIVFGGTGVVPNSVLNNIAATGGSSSSSGDLTATSSGTNQIYLSWPSVSGVSYYTITRATSYSGSYSTIYTTSATSYTDSGLSTGTTYYYRVQGVNSYGATVYNSSIASASPSSSSSGDLSATSSGSNQIYLSWPSISGVSYYIITRSTSYNGSYSTIYTTSGTSYTDYSLSTGITYYYRVQGINSSGSTVYNSSIASASPNSSSSGDLTASSSGSGQIYLYWPSISGVSYYIITRSTSYYGSYSTIYTTSGTSYTDSDLPTGITYYYKIQGINSYGATVYNSSIASASTSGSTYTYPAQPSGLAFSAVDSYSIRLSWDAVANASGYYIYRASSSDGTYYQIDSTDSTSYTNTGLSPSTSYYYKVAAYNSYGYSLYSSAILATTALPAPTGLTATVRSSSQIDLSWTAVSGAASYLLSWSSAADGTYTSLEPLTAVSYAHTSRTPGTTYYYKVQAQNSNGLSSFSSVASATTTTTDNPGTSRVDFPWPAVSTSAASTPAASMTAATPTAFIETASATSVYPGSTGFSENSVELPVAVTIETDPSTKTSPTKIVFFLTPTIKVADDQKTPKVLSGFAASNST
jgi:fibronectin type 3 domain-containing protein/putative cell wall-binding protein